MSASRLPTKRHDRRNKGGRPTKLTDPREETILTMLRAGNTREAAAAAARIDPATMRRWCAGNARFRAVVEEAENAAEAMFASRIRKAATEAEITEHFDQRGNLLRRTVKYDWKAAAWWLERRRGQTWKPAPGQLEISGPDGGPIEQNVNVTVWRPDPAWLAAFANSEGELPPDVRVVGPGADRVQPGPLLLPEPL